MPAFVSTATLAWRLLRRDARAGELHLLAAGLVLAVAALSAVGFFTDRVHRALEREAHQLLGADLLLIADHPWPSSIVTNAHAHGLRVVETQTFPSMVTLADRTRNRAQLAEIKAVNTGYPLRGALRIAPSLNAADATTRDIPAPGTVWIDERLASTLAVQIGDPLALGRSTFRIAAVLTQEPDRGINFFSVAPRLLMNLVDLPATDLVQPGSRVTYRLLLAGEASAVRNFQRWLDARLARGERIEDAQNARPEIRSVLERAQKFLALAALLTVVLCAVAVALAARRYLQRHLDTCAIMRCLGATQNLLLRLYLSQFIALGILASLLGCALGYFAHFALYAWLANLLAMSLPSSTLLPLWQGISVGLLLLFGFAVPPLLQLKETPTLRILRREGKGENKSSPALLYAYTLGFLTLAGLMFWIAGEWRLGAYVIGGFSAALLLFALLAHRAIALAAGWQTSGIAWRYGIANLQRHAMLSVVQIVALSLGFMALLLLTATRADLLDAWRRTAPPDAPNRFVINIQPEQLPALARTFADAGLPVQFAPMVRGRLTHINDAVVSAANYEEERAKRLVDREFNLSWRADLPEGNVVSAGRWFAASDRGQGIASVEEGLAQTLGLKVGDRLEFTVGGEAIKLRIVGLRKLDWDTMRVNFFVLTPPAVLEAYPTSWITSFYLPPDKSDFANRLVHAFPNLTLIDVAAIVRQLQAVLDQVTQAVQFVFLFTLAAGIVVLYTAFSSVVAERRYEVAVLRALGAGRKQLRRILLTEFAVIGGIAGLLAALGALAVGQVLAHKVFHFALPIDFCLPAIATLGGAMLTGGTSWFIAARLLRKPPVETLRAGI